MKRTTIFSLILVGIVIIFLVGLAFKVKIGPIADSVAIVKTSGMTCASCSTTICKALATMAGVAVTEVNVGDGWVIVGYDSKKTGAAGIAETISRSGFGSSVYAVMSPAQFRQATGRNVGQYQPRTTGCCDTSTGCNRN